MPRSKRRLEQIVSPCQISPINSTIKNNNFSLPRFNNNSFNSVSNDANSGLQSHKNKVKSIDARQDHSFDNYYNAEERKNQILSKTNEAIQQIFNSQKKKFNLAHIPDTTKSKVKLKQIDTWDKSAGVRKQSTKKHQHDTSAVDTLCDNLTNKPDMSLFSDHRIATFGNSIMRNRSPQVTLNKNLKLKKLPKMQSSKFTESIPNVRSKHNEKLPTLTQINKSTSPKVNRAVAMSNVAASSSSKVITLETMMFGEVPKVVDPDLIKFINHDSTKLSTKKNGLIKSYAANTNQGILRDYNEDRVSIILNLAKPENKKTKNSWPKISFFGVFDGHGGVSCADFLRDNLHNFIVKDKNFPESPKIAIYNGFIEAE